MKSLREIENLKMSWLEDPCWDIEDTEGFEDYKDELLQFSEKQKEKWRALRYKQLEKKAKNIGMPGNLELALYVEWLEDRVVELSNRVSKLEQ